MEVTELGRAALGTEVSGRMGVQGWEGLRMQARLMVMPVLD